MGTRGWGEKRRRRGMGGMAGNRSGGGRGTQVNFVKRAGILLDVGGI